MTFNLSDPPSCKILDKTLKNIKLYLVSEKIHYCIRGKSFEHEDANVNIEVRRSQRGNVGLASNLDNNIFARCKR